MTAVHERPVRAVNALVEAVAQAVEDAGFPPLEHKAATKKWPFCQHSFVTGWHDGYTPDSTSRNVTGTGVELSYLHRLRVDIARTAPSLDPACGDLTATLGVTLPCGDPVVVPPSDGECVVVNPGDPWPEAMTSSQAWNAATHDREAVRLDAPGLWCTALRACGFRMSCSQLALVSAVPFEEGHHIGTRFTFTAAL